MTIGEGIADLRKKSGFSQEMLGEKLGVSRQAVSKWESDAALPEIDKLVELAKLFDVTVGFLLGVEKDTRTQESIEQPQENGNQLHMNADCLQASTDQSKDADRKGSAEKSLEEYFEKLSKEGKLSQKETEENRLHSRRRYGILVAAAGICVAILFGCVANLRKEVTNLQNQLYNVQASVDGISDTVASQVQSILSEANSTLTGWTFDLESADYLEQTAVIRLEAMPKEKVDSADEVLFTARLTDGEILQSEDVTLDEAGGVIARIELPIEDDIEFYLRIGDDTVWLTRDGSDYDNLREQLLPTFEVYVGGTVSGGIINATAELTADDAECEMIRQTDSAPEISLRLMRGEDILQELDYEKTPPDDVSVLNSWVVTADFELRAADLSPAAEAGEEIRVVYEVTYSNGAVFSGTAGTYYVLEDGGYWSIETTEESDLSATYYIDNY